jgi:protein phosphatase PTC6
LGGEDNATAIVVPLSGWGKIHGPDKTKELREYRRSQAGVFSGLKLIFESDIILSWE